MKRYLFDSEWVPSAGMKILNDDASICDIDIAELRINKLQLDKVFFSSASLCGNVTFEREASSWILLGTLEK